MSEQLLSSIKKRDFTIERLLTSDAAVFFENIFSTRHIGRVVDFMLYQARPFMLGTDDVAQTEYRFRQVIELLIFNGWTNFRTTERSRCVEVEFGWDKDRLVVAVSHLADPDAANFMPGSTEPASDASNRMIKMFTQVQALADGLVVRHDPETGRVQAIAFLSMSAEEKLARSEYLDVGELPAEPVAEAAPAAADGAPGADVAPPAPTESEVPAAPAPAELSTGDVEGFLADESAAPPPPPPEPEVETVIKGDAPEPEAVTVVSGGKIEEDNTITKVTGAKIEEDNTITKVTGEKVEEDKTVTRISGEKVVEDRTVMRIAGGNAPVADRSVMRISGGASGETVNREPMQTRRAGPAGDGMSSQASAAREKMLETQLKNMQDQIESLKRDRSNLHASLAENNRVAGEKLAKAVAAATDENDGALGKMRSEIESSSVPDTAKQWANQMMAVTVKERAELAQRMRDVDSMLRKREFEFKSRETSLGEQVRGLEQTLKQRDAALEKSKETHSNLSATLDKLKGGTTDAQEKVTLAHKLVNAEKMLSVEKDNFERQQKRFEDLQKKLNEEIAGRGTLQQDVAKFRKQSEDLQRKVTQLQEAGQKGAVGEIQALTEQRDKSMKFVEELKRQMRELQAKLTTTAASGKGAGGAQAGDKKGGSTQSEAELKHKLDLAEKLSKASKDELEKTKKRFEEVKAQEGKLRSEISKLQAELAKAQADAKAAGLRTAAATAGAAKAAAAKPK